MKYLFIALLLFVAQLQAENIVKVPTPGTLSTSLSQAQKDTCTQLTVQGKLNSADIRVLRQMAGYKEDGCSTGVLSTLNLAEAEFVTDKEPYMVLDAKEEYLTIAATPGSQRTGQQIMGLPLTIHEQKSIGSYGRRTDLMLAKSGGVSYYKPKFFIGKSIGSKTIYNGYVYQYDDELMSPTLNGSRADAVLSFADSVGEKIWRQMKNRKVTHFKGHQVTKQGDKYLLFVSSHKGFLPHDMFYKCNNLNSVIMPAEMHIDKTITDETSRINYYIPYNKVTIYYLKKAFIHSNYHPGSSQNILNEKKIKLKDKEADNLISLLENLKPIQVEKSFWIRHPRAQFSIEKKNGESPEYTIDINNKYIERFPDKQFFKPSNELIAKIKELGII